MRRIGPAILCLGLFGAACSKTTPDSDVVAAMDRLGEAPLRAPVDLGLPHAVGTAETDVIIAKGEPAAASLVKFLDSPNLRKVGYAAYCLRRLDSRQGKAAAIGRRDAVLGKRHILNLSFDERFAVVSLEDYIRHCETVASAASP